MSESKLTEAQKRNINSYGDKIVTMKDEITAIRALPGMYLGAIENAGYFNMFREIYQNAIDQITDPESPANYVKITVDDRTHEISVFDNGNGLPFNKMKDILTKNHTSKNYNKGDEGARRSAGQNGVGLKIVNALCETLIAESYIYTGEARRLESHEGYITTKEPVPIPNKNKIQGTKIIFKPSKIMGHIDLKWKVLYNLVRELISLVDKGVVADFEAIDIGGVVHKEHIVNEDGIGFFLVNISQQPIVKPIDISFDNGDLMIHALFTWDVEAMKHTAAAGERVVSYCNWCPITDMGSKNITGTLLGICGWFQKYINNIFLANSRSKVRVIPTDVKNGLRLVIDSGVLKAIFTGQAKQNLSNTEMEPFANKVIMAGLDEWSKNNPNDLKKVSEFIVDMAKARTSADNEKMKISTNYEVSAFGGGLPKDYKRPLGKKDLEFWICEGQSAIGSLDTARDSARQGLFPIRGKIISAFSNSPKKVFENEEVQGILACIFQKGKALTPKECLSLTANDCKFSKIVICCDADIDGYHIASLLLRFFILYCPYLIEAGLVYKAMPPLYMVPKGNKRIYYLDNTVMAKENLKTFKKTYTICDGKTQIPDKQIEDILVRNADYVYELETAAINHGVTPKLLEITLINYMANGNAKSLEKAVKKEYRFVKFSLINNIPKIEISDDKLYTIYYTDKLFQDCKKILKLMTSNDKLSYNVNGVSMSMYEIMKIFEGIRPAGIQRFKGLGEQSPIELRESTTSIETRSLVKYTVTDVKEEIERIRRIESNRHLILDFVDRVDRSDLIGV